MKSGWMQSRNSQRQSTMLSAPKTAPLVSIKRSSHVLASPTTSFSSYFPYDDQSDPLDIIVDDSDQGEESRTSNVMNDDSISCTPPSSINLQSRETISPKKKRFSKYANKNRVSICRSNSPVTSNTHQLDPDLIDMVFDTTEPIEVAIAEAFSQQNARTLKKTSTPSISNTLSSTKSTSTSLFPHLQKNDETCANLQTIGRQQSLKMITSAFRQVDTHVMITPSKTISTSKPKLISTSSSLSSLLPTSSLNFEKTQTTCQPESVAQYVGFNNRFNMSNMHGCQPKTNLGRIFAFDNALSMEGVALPTSQPIHQHPMTEISTDQLLDIMATSTHVQSRKCHVRIWNYSPHIENLIHLNSEMKRMFLYTPENHKVNSVWHAWVAACSDNEILDMIQVPTQSTQHLHVMDMQFEYRLGYHVRRYFDQQATLQSTMPSNTFTLPSHDDRHCDYIDKPIMCDTIDQNRDDSSCVDQKPDDSSCVDVLLHSNSQHNCGVKMNAHIVDAHILPEHVYRWWYDNLKTPQALLIDPTIMNQPGSMPYAPPLSLNQKKMISGHNDQPLNSQHHKHQNHHDDHGKKPPFNAKSHNSQRILPSSLGHSHIDAVFNNNSTHDQFFANIPANQSVSTLSALIINHQPPSSSPPHTHTIY